MNVLVDERFSLGSSVKMLSFYRTPTSGQYISIICVKLWARFIVFHNVQLRQSFLSAGFFFFLNPELHCLRQLYCVIFSSFVFHYCKHSRCRSVSFIITVILNLWPRPMTLCGPGFFSMSSTVLQNGCSFYVKKKCYFTACHGCMCFRVSVFLLYYMPLCMRATWVYVWFCAFRSKSWR